MVAEITRPSARLTTRVTSNDLPTVGPRRRRVDVHVLAIAGPPETRLFGGQLQIDVEGHKIEHWADQRRMRSLQIGNPRYDRGIESHPLDSLAVRRSQGRSRSVHDQPPPPHVFDTLSAPP